MNVRVLRTESRRSVAPWAGAVILVGALALLYGLSGPWWNGTARWTAQWTSMALWTRGLLNYLWPLAVGLGALQGLRDHRSAMSELLTSTPRPAWHRAAVLAGSSALTLATGFALVVLVGGVQVLSNTAYTHLGWLPISLVAGFSLVAGAVLGMGVARALPSVLTPPALTVGALLLTALLRLSTDSAVPSGSLPNRVALLSPAVDGARQVLLTPSASVHLGQTLWLLGMAGTGFALLVAATPRVRLLALTPLLAGASAALLVLPSSPRQTYVVDEEAAAPVCDGPVCVTRAHQARLAGLADPGRKALRLLHGALPRGQAPDSVRESTALRGIGDPAPRSRSHVLVDFEDKLFDSAKGEELTRSVVALGIAPTCLARSSNESGTLEEVTAQSIAASWVLGDLKPLDDAYHDPAEQMAEARPVWKKLRALPRDRQRARIAALHSAALSCDIDVLDVLAGGDSR